VRLKHKYHNLRCCSWNWWTEKLSSKCLFYNIWLSAGINIQNMKHTWTVISSHSHTKRDGVHVTVTITVIFAYNWSNSCLLIGKFFYKLRVYILCWLELLWTNKEQIKKNYTTQILQTGIWKQNNKCISQWLVVIHEMDKGKRIWAEKVTARIVYRWIKLNLNNTILGLKIKYQ
jgi:hypothetical protein